MNAHVDDTFTSRAASYGSLIAALEADHTRFGRHRRTQAVKAAEQHYFDAPPHLRDHILAAREGQPPAEDPGALAYELGIMLEKGPTTEIVGRWDPTVSPRAVPVRGQ